jgi:hypothetical protein
MIQTFTLRSAGSLEPRWDEARHQAGIGGGPEPCRSIVSIEFAHHKGHGAFLLRHRRLVTKLVDLARS